MVEGQTAASYSVCNCQLKLLSIHHNSSSLLYCHIMPALSLSITHAHTYLQDRTGHQVIRSSDQVIKQLSDDIGLPVWPTGVLRIRCHVARQVACSKVRSSPGTRLSHQIRGYVYLAPSLFLSLSPLSPLSSLPTPLPPSPHLLIWSRTSQEVNDGINWQMDLPCKHCAHAGSAQDWIWRSHYISFGTLFTP